MAGIGEFEVGDYGRVGGCGYKKPGAVAGFFI